MNITVDAKRLCDVCYTVGYVRGIMNSEDGDECTDNIMFYIKDLFAAKQEEPVGDYVTVETYESEINKLKSIIEEKNKEIERLKAPSIEILRKDFSHHPQENIYAKSLKNFDAEKERDKEDWRMP